MRLETSNNTICQKGSFVLLEITEAELTKVVHSVRCKESAGLDVISPYLLKKCMPYMLKPFLELVNASVKVGTSPCI
jgi:hypothetical protein